jgi:pimeloyl-ACP methyl ester carboxylesterase
MTLRTLPWTEEIVLAGRGPGRVLFFAGFGSGPEPLRELAEAIRAHTGATVVVAALSRHGGDTPDFFASRSWHYLEAAERRFAAFAAEADGPIVIGGYSTGALIALLLLARSPGRVSGLVLVSPVLRLSSSERQLAAYTVVSTYYALLPAAMLGTVAALAWVARTRKWPRHHSALAVMGSVAMFASAAAGLRALTVPLSPGGPLVRDGEEVVPPHFTRASLITGSTLVPLQLAARWRLKQIERPVCFVFGDRDATVDVRFGTLRAAETPGAELHVVPGAPHRVATDERCHEIVASFVARALARRRRHRADEPVAHPV